jgi:Xaa-Pro dipeptidase
MASPEGGPIGNDFFPPFSDAEMARRHARVRTGMQQKGLDALVIYGSLGWGTSVGHVNLQYLTRYASLRDSFLVLPAVGEPTMFISLDLHIPNARDLAYVKDVRSVDAGRNVAARLNELRLERGRIGVVGPGPSAGLATGRVTLYTEHRDLLCASLPSARFEDVTLWFEEFRLVKSDEEIALLMRGGQLTDLAHEEVFQLTRPGIRHTDLRRAVATLAARHGATYPFAHVGSFSMTNPTGYYPDFYPTDRRVEFGDVVMTELALGYGNYWGKLWGSYFVGTPTDEYLRLFEVAADVHDRIVPALRPGFRGCESKPFIDRIRGAGLGQSHVLIGGWSSLIHAPAMGALPGTPSAARAQQFDDFELEPGHTLTICVWLHVPDTRKGLWVGSSGVITEDGYQSYHAYPVNKLRFVPGTDGA